MEVEHIKSKTCQKGTEYESYKLKERDIKTKCRGSLKLKYDLAARALRTVIKFNVPKSKIKGLNGEYPVSKIKMITQNIQYWTCSKMRTTDTEFYEEDSNLAVEANAITELALQRYEEIEYLLKKFNLINNKLLDLWHLRILIAELLWGKQVLKSSAPIVLFTKKYEHDLRESFIEVSTVIQNSVDRDKLFFPTYVRINTLSISVENSIYAFAKEGWNLLPRCKSYLDHLKIVKNLNGKNFIKDFHVPELFVFPPRTSFYKHSGYLKGKFVIQDKGSCLSSFLLNPKPGSVVLDMCATFGFKTNHLANIMNNEGIIYATDFLEERLEKTVKFLELTKVKCVNAVRVSAYKTNSLDKIEYILLEPPCTYSGLFLKKNNCCQKNRIKNYAQSAESHLRFALQMFPKVKRVVYTVCSIHPKEGKIVVNEALEAVGNSYTLLDVRKMLHREWQSLRKSDFACSDKCLQIEPAVNHCQGYFIAVFQRNFDVPVPLYESNRLYKRNLGTLRIFPENSRRSEKFIQSEVSFAVNSSNESQDGLNNIELTRYKECRTIFVKEEQQELAYPVQTSDNSKILVNNDVHQSTHKKTKDISLQTPQKKRKRLGRRERQQKWLKELKLERESERLCQKELKMKSVWENLKEKEIKKEPEQEKSSEIEIKLKAEQLQMQQYEPGCNHPYQTYQDTCNSGTGLLVQLYKTYQDACQSAAQLEQLYRTYQDAYTSLSDKNFNELEPIYGTTHD